MRRAESTVRHNMQNVFVFVLLGVFAAVSMLLVLLGAQMYRATVDRTQTNNENRVLTAYVRSMVRAQEFDGALCVEEHDGVTALAMHEQLGDRDFVTWIYCYDGNVYELFTEPQYGLTPEQGSVICAANAFVPSIDDGMLTVQLEDAKGTPSTLTTALRCAARE